MSVREEPQHRRRLLRRVPWGRTLLVLFALAVVLGLLALLPAFAARSRLESARASMLEGRDSLVSGDAREARSAFARAESSFVAARAHARNPLLRIIGFLPVVGRTPDTIAAITEAGVDVARAGVVMSTAVSDLPGGASALAPHRGRIPVETLRDLASPLARARDLLHRAVGIMDGAPTTLLPGPVASARSGFEEELEAADRAVTAAAAMAEHLPAFLGADGARRYFLGAQNPAELRGTGGFVGAYSILTARNGRLEFGPFRPVQSLADVDPSEVKPPNPDYATLYDRFESRGFWPNINMTPDFPSAALAIERLYRTVEGDRLDGAILADPEALAALLSVTGPVEVPNTGTTIDARSAVPYLTNGAYAEITDPELRKWLLGDAAATVFARFLAGGADPAAAGRALVDAASEGHLVLHSADPRTQGAFREAGVAGALGAETGDYLAVVGNNAAGNKTDFYQERTVRYSVRLGAGGTGVGRATVSLTNDSPSRGQPPYVIGPFDERFRPGENLTYLSTYCARTCLLEGFERDGAPDSVGSGVELGHPVFPAFVDLRSGEAARLQYDWTVAEAWHGDEGSGVYRLTFDGQTTIRPTRLVVDVRVPEGMQVVGTSPGMRVDGSRASWEGRAGDRMTFEVAFQRPALARAWRTVLRFLGKPLFGT
jgi:hypothetical protein